MFDRRASRVAPKAGIDPSNVGDRARGRRRARWEADRRVGFVEGRLLAKLLTPPGHLSLAIISPPYVNVETRQPGAPKIEFCLGHRASYFD